MIRTHGLRKSRLLVTFALMGALMAALTACQSSREAERPGVESGFVGLNAQVASVASLFVSRWDVAVREEISSPCHNRLGIAVAMRV